MKTSIICVLDRSGSMSHIMNEAVGTFNGFVDGQREVEGEAEVSLYAFNWEINKVFDKVPLPQVKPLELSQVIPTGGTSLYDAIGRAILECNNENAIVLIQTDGEENTSKVFNDKTIKEMIRVKEAMGWEFHFIGAGVDAFKAGQSFGIAASNCLNVAASAKGMGDMGAYFSSTTQLYRSSKAHKPTPFDVGGNQNGWTESK
jgi:hypothetical protein